MAISRENLPISIIIVSILAFVALLYTKRIGSLSSKAISRPSDWGHENGTKCFDETRPVDKKRHWGSGSDKQMMGVVGRMKVPVTVVNITQLSEYRIDGHTSVYTEVGGKVLTEEQKADPFHYADCIHWCLPGVPDTWNQILYTHLML